MDFSSNIERRGLKRSHPSSTVKLPPRKILIENTGSVETVTTSDTKCNNHEKVAQILEETVAESAFNFNKNNFNAHFGNVGNIVGLNEYENSWNIWTEPSVSLTGDGSVKNFEKNYALECERECFENLALHCDTLKRNSNNGTPSDCYDTDYFNRPSSSSTLDTSDCFTLDKVDYKLDDDSGELSEPCEIVMCTSFARKNVSPDNKSHTVCHDKVNELKPTISTDHAAVLPLIELDRISCRVTSSKEKTLNGVHYLQQQQQQGDQSIECDKEDVYIIEPDGKGEKSEFQKHIFSSLSLKEENKHTTTNKISAIVEDLNSYSTRAETVVDYFLQRDNTNNSNQDLADFYCTNSSAAQQTKVVSNSVSQNNIKESFSYDSLKSENFNKSVKNYSDCNSIYISSSEANSDRKNSTSNANRINELVSQCLKGWKIKYPWVDFSSEKCSLSCQICSVDSLNPFVVLEIEDSGAVFKVATNLLKHSLTEKHILLHFVNISPELDKIFNLLNFSVSSSKEILFRNISHIITTSTGTTSISDSGIILLIKAISQVVNEIIIHILQAHVESGISYLYDPCRRITIARFCRDRIYPEEIVLTDFMFSSTLSLREYFSAKSLYTLKSAITFIRYLPCSNCQQCNYSKSPPTTLPPRSPSFKIFQKFLLLNKYILTYSQFVYCLATLVKQNSLEFSSVLGIKVILRKMWFDIRIYHFLRSNYTNIMSILKRVCSASTNHSYTKFCNETHIVFTNFFYFLIDLISSVCNLYNSPIHSREWHLINDELKIKMKTAEEFFKQDKLKDSSFGPTLFLIEIFVNELRNVNYMTGKENVKDFYLYFQPFRLAVSGNKTSEISIIRNAHALFGSLLKLPIQEFLVSLSTFGVYLCASSSKEKFVTMYKVLKMFSEVEDLQRWHHIRKFYELLATLPFLSASQEKSIFEVVALKMYLYIKYGRDLAVFLFPIVIEGHRVTPISKFQNKIRKIILTF